MAGKISRIINLVGNMGWRYAGFRARHEVLRRTGLLKGRFPVAPPHQQHVTLEQWKNQGGQFFFKDRGTVAVPVRPTDEIAQRFKDITEGRLLLFNSLLTNLGRDYDWVTNPDSGFRYDSRKHWTEIPDLSKEAGDIKFVWEKSRFSYLYDIIRYDHHYQHDCADMVFRDIASWIEGNPVNCGPNYRCSQEMSLRVLNWTFALHYYRNSKALTEELFDKIQYAIYWHLHHIYNNIDFSRIAVRNNHAITETLTLYLAGLLYPTLPDAAKWKRMGKQWFEQEIAYQVYKDGTFLQFSMNYHRIVVQLLTWGITLAEKNGERFAPVVYERAKASLGFLRSCMVEENGYLPNYGANDGALFFKLSDGAYRDYRPALDALGSVLGIDAATGDCEDKGWYGHTKAVAERWTPPAGAYSYPDGGYYIIREPETMTFIKCGGYKDRPSQADNLHVDVWYRGENVLPDAGSYKYNTDEATMRYFNGTRSHNTLMAGDHDQMLKGGRFIWYYWSKCLQAVLRETDKEYIFEGAIQAYRHVSADVKHTRKVVKRKNATEWQVTDTITGLPAGMEVHQLWHTEKESRLQFAAVDGASGKLQAQVSEGWMSAMYGRKEATTEIDYSTTGTTITTTITLPQGQ